MHSPDAVRMWTVTGSAPSIEARPRAHHAQFAHHDLLPDVWDVLLGGGEKKREYVRRHMGLAWLMLVVGVSGGDGVLQVREGVSHGDGA